MSVHVLVRELLDRNHASYTVISHPGPDFAPRTTHTASAAGRGWVATAVIRHGGALSLAVLPHDTRVDLPRLSAALRGPVELADERELAPAVPDARAGALPPFGILFGLKTYADESLTHERTITFRADQGEAIQMPFEDYRRVAAPVVLWLAESTAGTER